MFKAKRFIPIALLTLILSVLVSVLPFSPALAVDVEAGKFYSVPIKGDIATDGKEYFEAMNLVHTAKVELEDGSIYAYITSATSGYSFVNGVSSEVVTISGKTYTIYKVKLDNINDPVTVKYMRDRYEFNINFDSSKLQEVTNLDVVPDPGPSEQDKEDKFNINTAAPLVITKDGEYTIDVSAKKTAAATENHDQMNGQLTSPAKLVVKNGVMTVTFKHVRPIKFTNQGTKNLVSRVVDKSDSASTISFVLQSTNQIMEAWFPAGGNADGGKMNFFLVFDANSIKDSSGNSVPSESTSSSGTGNTSGSGSSGTGNSTGTSTTGTSTTGTSTTGTSTTGTSTTGTSTTETTEKETTTKAEQLYRVYNPNSGEHLFTNSAAEAKALAALGWKEETGGWKAPATGTPVYRLYNPNSGEHFYTLDAAEYESVAKAGWRKEGQAFYSAEKGVAVYRLYNPNAKGAGSHHFTTDAAEKDKLVAAGWKNEGIAFYGVE